MLVGYVPRYTEGICSVNALPKSWVRFGPASIPSTERSGNVRYELDTGTRHFVKFGIPTKILGIPVYPTELNPKCFAFTVYDQTDSIILFNSTGGRRESTRQERAEVLSR